MVVHHRYRQKSAIVAWVLTPAVVFFLDEKLILEGEVFDLADCTVPESICHRAKSVMSLSAGTNHFYLIGSHLAPSAFASSFWAKVTFR